MLPQEASACALYNLSSFAAQTSTVTGSAVDVSGIEGNLVILQEVGTVSGTTPTLDGKIQDSDDGSTGWADVSGAAFTQVTASNSKQKLNLPASAFKKFVRYVGTIAGTTPSFIVGCTVLGRPKVV